MIQAYYNPSPQYINYITNGNGSLVTIEEFIVLSSKLILNIAIVVSFRSYNMFSKRRITQILAWLLLSGLFFFYVFKTFWLDMLLAIVLDGEERGCEENTHRLRYP